MLLENYYYKLLNEPARSQGLHGVYRVAILPDCPVYAGHFPSNPVCPGVCNIETIKECAMLLTGETLCIRRLKQCRLTAIATPRLCRELSVSVEAERKEDGYSVKARMYDEVQTYMELRGDFSIQQKPCGRHGGAS